LPPAPVLATVIDVAFQASSVASGQPVQAVVTVASPAPAGLLVWLTTSHPLASAPVSVSIPEGQTRGTFVVSMQAAIVDTTVTIRASSGTSERTATLRLIAPPPQASGGSVLRFISHPHDPVGQGQSLRFEPSNSVQFRGVVGTYRLGTSFEHSLELTIIEGPPRAPAFWMLVLVAPRGQRLVPGVYRNARSTPESGSPALSFSGGSRGCISSGEFEIFEAQYAPRSPSGERIDRLVARFRQTCGGATGELSGEVSVSNVPSS
jgi:hypothetical protein